MKVLIINIFCGLGSTGRIAAEQYKALKKAGHDAKIVYGVKNALDVDFNDTYKMNTTIGYYTHNALARLTDGCGKYSILQTKRLIRYIKKYDPDIIQLHNLHGFYINLKILFDYLKESEKQVVWTLHDCWAFTGHCTHFDYIGCDKWKDGCSKCTQSREYPKSYIDNSRKNYILKKKLFTSVKNMTIVTPSVWLAELVKKSYLCKYPIKVIYNGIDTDKFTPKRGKFKKKYKLENRKIILAVANVWGKRKGLQDIIKLSEMLNDEYRVVMVGIRNEQKKILPQNVIGIERTESVEELAKIYSDADIFVNPTYEDNFPTVNIESLACGTPVITYNTGGSPEAIDKKSGIITKERLAESIMECIDAAEKLSRKDCAERGKLFNKYNKYDEYISLYKKLLY